MDNVIDTIINGIEGKAIAKVINEFLDKEAINHVKANKVTETKNEEELEISKRILKILLGSIKKKALELKKLIY